VWRRIAGEIEVNLIEFCCAETEKRREFGGDADWAGAALNLNPAIWEAIAGTGCGETQRTRGGVEFVKAARERRTPKI
jgi:hypothetical protein